jgi:Na+/H+-translocating membrane pyrophosphatase
MRSVGEAANAMVLNIAKQFAESKGDNSLAKVAGMDFFERQKYKAELAAKGEKLVKPNYEECIAISTQASLREMIAPGCLVIITPVLAGALFGVEAVSGLLTGAIVSSVQLAISMSTRAVPGITRRSIPRRVRSTATFRSGTAPTTSTRRCSARTRRTTTATRA